MNYWEMPGGRCRREAYIVHVGDQHKDIDELRTWLIFGPWFREAIRALNPPANAQERAWLLAFARDNSFYTQMYHDLFGPNVLVVDEEPELLTGEP